MEEIRSFVEETFEKAKQEIAKGNREREREREGRTRKKKLK